MAIARCLTEPESGSELEQQLSIFVRDEMIFWFTQQHKSSLAEGTLRDTTVQNCELVVKKAVVLARPPDVALPANQTVVDQVVRAVNPAQLAVTDALWMGYL